MTRAEREAFLAGVHVGILAIEEPGRGPLALPVWYAFEGGEVLINIDSTTRKGELLRNAGRATLTVQDETPPYKYVCVEGPVELGPYAGNGVELASRYLGRELGEWYENENPPTADAITVRLRPEHWRTYDFGKLFA